MIVAAGTCVQELEISIDGPVFPEARIDLRMSTAELAECAE
jgi:hypothetical protein